VWIFVQIHVGCFVFLCGWINVLIHERFSLQALPEIVLDADWEGFSPIVLSCKLNVALCVDRCVDCFDTNIHTLIDTLRICSELQLQIKKLKDFCERVRARVEIGENDMS